MLDADELAVAPGGLGVPVAEVLLEPLAVELPVLLPSWALVLVPAPLLELDEELLPDGDVPEDVVVELSPVSVAHPLPDPLGSPVEVPLVAPPVELVVGDAVDVEAVTAPLAAHSAGAVVCAPPEAVAVLMAWPFVNGATVAPPPVLDCIELRSFRFRAAVRMAELVTAGNFTDGVTTLEAGGGALAAGASVSELMRESRSGSTDDWLLGECEPMLGRWWGRWTIVCWMATALPAVATAATISVAT